MEEDDEGGEGDVAPIWPGNNQGGDGGDVRTWLEEAKFDEEELEFTGRAPSIASLLTLIPGVEDEEGVEPAPAPYPSQLWDCTLVRYPHESMLKM